MKVRKAETKVRLCSTAFVVPALYYRRSSLRAPFAWLVSKATFFSPVVYLQPSLHLPVYLYIFLYAQLMASLKG